MPTNVIADFVTRVEEVLERRFVTEAVLDATADYCHLAVRERARLGRRLILHVLSRDALRAKGLDAALADALDRWKSLHHQRIVPIAHGGETTHLLWCAIAEPTVPSLADRLRQRGPMPPDLALRVAEEVGAALREAHERGLAHGGLRPAEVLLDPAGGCQVGGFALAAAFDALGGLPTTGRSPRADQAALARLFRACIVGRHSFADDDPAADDGIAAPVQLVLDRAAGDGGRVPYADITEFVQALRSANRGTPVAAPRATPQSLLFVEPPRRIRLGWRIALVASLVLIGAMPFQWIWGAREPEVRLPPLRPRTASAPAREPVPVRETPLPPPSGAPTAQAPARRTPPPPPPTRTSPPASRALAAGPSAPAVSEPSPAPVTTSSAPDPLPALLGVSAQPWGSVYVDDLYVGDTPLSSVEVRAGQHLLRIVRPGYRAIERSILARPGEQIRLVDLRLVRETP